MAHDRNRGTLTASAVERTATPTDGCGEDTFRILLVEPDRQIAELATAFLSDRRDSFDVLWAPDAETAVDRLEPGAIDCVVTEYELPDSTGMALRRTIDRSSEEIPFVFFSWEGSFDSISGTDATDRAVGSSEGALVLEKRPEPERFDLLADRVEAMVTDRSHIHQHSN